MNKMVSADWYVVCVKNENWQIEEYENPPAISSIWPGVQPIA